MKLKTIGLLAILGTVIVGCKTSQANHKKPVIYVYNQEQDTISISLEYKGELTSTYPELDESWEVVADSEGKITDVINGRNYSYLFYEGLADYTVDYIDYGYTIQTDTIVTFLENTLDQIGFNYKESNDFITFWLPELQAKDYVVLRFLFNDECDRYSKLKITPKPDTEIRLMMEFTSLENPIQVDAQELIEMKRKPYTVVEWGGINYTNFLEL